MHMSLPGRRGLPYFGESLAILTDTLGYARQHLVRYGTVFQTRFLGQDTVVMLGEEAQRLVLLDQATNFSSRAGWESIHALFGDGLLLTDDPVHEEQRHRVTPAFHAEAISRYVTRMNAVADAQLARWGTHGARSWYDEAHEMAFTVSASLMIGLDLGQDYQRFRRWWDRFAAGGQTLIRFDTPLLPWLKFRQAMNARRRIERLFRRLVAQKRAQPTQDVLGILVQAGELSEQQLLDQAKVFFFAGFDTTADTLTWLLAELLTHPTWLTQVTEELAGDATAPLTYDEARRTPITAACIKETLRLHPQLAWIPRGVRETFTFGGYTIPAGTYLLLVPDMTHRMPEYFNEPERFNPARFLGETAEDKVHPYAFVGFGAGPHNCIGSRVAQTEITIIMAKLLRRFAVTLRAGEDLTTGYLPLSRPRGNVTIQYTPRTTEVSEKDVA